MRKGLLLSSLVLLAASNPQAYAQSPPSVSVRTGAHENFDRIVFDWPHSVKFQLHQEGSRASIAFEADANLKLPPESQTGQLTRAKNFSLSKDDKGQVTVSFNVNPKASVRSFTNATSVVVDIQGKAASVESQTPASPGQTGADPLGSEATSTQAPQQPEPAAEEKPDIKPAPPPAKAQIPLKNAFQSKPAAETPPPDKAVPQDQPQTASPPQETPAPAPDKATARSDNDAPLKAEELSDTPMLVAALDPRVPIRAAIYQRANFAYIIFDRKLSLPLSTLQKDAPAMVALQALELSKNSAYRFPVAPQTDLYATLDGTAWKIFLSKKKATIPVTTTLVAQPDFALGARLLLPLPDAPDPLRFIDPVVGDELILVPLAQSEAFNVERRLADLTILPAAQGLVIKPMIDKLIVRAVSDGIEITSDNGLLLSRPTDTGASRQSPGKTKAAAAGKSIFDFATWKGKPGETFTQTRQRLQQIIVDVPEAERNRARMELARFYFANGHGEEAVSLLNFLAAQVPDLRAHGDFMALLGASKILAYRSEEGVKDLSMPALAVQPEVDLWVAVGMAQLRDWQTAEKKFSARKAVLTGYPEPFYSRFFVLAIESALAVGKDREAADWHDYISSAEHSPFIDPALAFLRGMLEAKAGRAASAEDSWKEAFASNNRLYKVRAELALIDLGVSTGSLTPAQAADRLEALRFGWRGDDLEVDILRRLGQFYIQAKNIKAGINALSQAVMLYPSSPLAPAIRAEMGRNFHDIFLGDLGKKFSPLDALTLYQQYRTLMPSGKEGDAVLSNLAERLVAVDLLDQAASILDDMVKNRLQGEEKVRAALRLSAIRLLDHKPDEALAALELTAADPLSSPLQNERALLRARAYSELGRDDDAVALLRENSSQGANMLRADMAMRDQKWADAAKNLMDLTGPPPAAGAALTPDQAEWLVKAAIAYALADDHTHLDRLAIDYGAAMTGMPQQDTFAMLTRPTNAGQLRDLTAAQAQLSQADMFQNFLNNYRSAKGDPVNAQKPIN